MSKDKLNLEEIGGWKTGTAWEEKWLDRCQWYFTRCQYNDWEGYDGKDI